MGLLGSPLHNVSGRGGIAKKDAVLAFEGTSKKLGASKANILEPWFGRIPWGNAQTEAT